jgi:hypothetical protein
MPLYEKIVENNRKIVFNAFFNGTWDIIHDFLKKSPREAFYMTLWAEDYDDAQRCIDKLTM